MKNLEDSNVELCCFFENPYGEPELGPSSDSTNEMPISGLKYAFVLINKENDVVIDYTYIPNVIQYGQGNATNNIAIHVMPTTGTQITVTGNELGFGKQSKRPQAGDNKAMDTKPRRGQN